MMYNQRGFGLTEVLLLVLLLSLGGNIFLFKSRDTALEEKAKYEVALTQWKASAETCTASVETLAKDGKQRHNQLLSALERETNRIKGLQHDALAALAAKPDDPKDLCGSVLRYYQAELKKERGGGK